MAQRSPSWLLSSVSFVLIGALLGSLLSHGIHYFTISCVSCIEGGFQEFTVGEKGQLARDKPDGMAETEKEEVDLNEMECNRIRTRLRGLRQLMGKGAAQLPPPANQSRPSSRDSLQEYLHPSNLLGKTDVVEAGTISLEEEYRSRKMLFVGVMTAQDYLPTRAVAVYSTWGIEVDKILFYVGDDCVVPKYLSMLPTITLPGVPDRVYPPQRKVFMMLKHMHDHYIDEFDWFMRADDDVYVRGKQLLDLVGKLNPAEEIYLGRPGAGKAEDIKRLKLLPHEQYCMGGPGVIFSNAALRSLVPHFDDCLEAIDYYNKFAKSPWYDEDVELGRCVSRKIGIQCSVSQEVYFPIFFNLYNPKFIQENTFESTQSVIKHHNGHWVHYSFGMLCIYAGDYRRTSGYDTQIRGWGEEDVELFRAVIQSDLEVFRSPDPGLVHHWHWKVCDEKIKDKETLYRYKRSQGENIANPIVLANYL